MWCCTKDEGLLALRSRPAGGGFKPPSAALAEDCRGERDGKGAHEASGGDQEDVALNAPVAGFRAPDIVTCLRGVIGPGFGPSLDLLPCFSAFSGVSRGLGGPGPEKIN